MRQFIEKKKNNPEKKIQKAIVDMLRVKGWFVKETHGSMFQSGFPDVFACHSAHGQRWIEVKLPGMKGSRFTIAQLQDFPKFCANGSAVWVLTGATHTEYMKLFDKCNWWQYMDVMK